MTIELRDEPIADARDRGFHSFYTLRERRKASFSRMHPGGGACFADDKYIRRKNVRSVLTLPLMKQGKPVAFLYLENNLAPLVFTPARVAVLKFLASEGCDLAR